MESEVQRRARVNNESYRVMTVRKRRRNDGCSRNSLPYRDPSVEWPAEFGLAGNRLMYWRVQRQSGKLRPAVVILVAVKLRYFRWAARLKRACEIR